MDFRIGYRRPLRTATLLRRKRQRMRILLGTLAAVSVLAIGANWQPNAPTMVAEASKGATPTAAPIVRVALNSTASGAATAASAARRIYPYSIVPGGVATRADLEQRVKTDAVVASHYASFDIAKTRAVTVTKARAVHVSYRKGDKVYWTKNKVMLAEGETLLSDGTHQLRGRCGNRISDTAMLPVAMGEPTAAELDESMNVALDAGDEGELQNASFVLGDEMPSGNPTQSRHFPGGPPSDAPPVDPYTRGGMPSVPLGAPGGMGLLPSRYLTVAAAPTTALGPVTEGAITVRPTPADATVQIPAPAPTATPSIPASGTPPLAFNQPVITLPQVSSDLPATAPPPVLVQVPVTPDTQTTPVTPVTPESPVAPDSPVTPIIPTTPVATVPPTEIPEPGTLPLVGVAFGLMLAVARTRRRQGSH